MVNPKRNNELPILLFQRQQDWAAWLDAHHENAVGVWLRLAKKAADLESVSYGEALEVALCYGWIDGLKKSHDDSSWLQRFTPRRPRSVWSRVNREKVEALLEAGRMHPAGMREVDRAKEDGRWDAAYDSPSRATVPDDLHLELDRSPRAKAFFDTLDRTNRYAILYRIQTARGAETRAKRIQQFIAMLERGEKLHP